MSMAAAKRTTWAEEWWQTLLERDKYEHSQKSARRSITPPCQNRGPAKDERKPYGYARVQVDSDADADNLESQRPALTNCAQVLEDAGSGASDFRL